ncbi:MAG: hypothetical protein ABH873_08750 [Candidatus Firestonebacteria bacterium]
MVAVPIYLFYLFISIYFVGTSFMLEPLVNIENEKGEDVKWN